METWPEPVAVAGGGAKGFPNWKLGEGSHWWGDRPLRDGVRARLMRRDPVAHVHARVVGGRNGVVEPASVAHVRMCGCTCKSPSAELSMECRGKRL